MALGSRCCFILPSYPPYASSSHPTSFCLSLGVIRCCGAPSRSLITSVMKDRKEDKLQWQRLLEGKKRVWGDGDIFLIGTYIPLLRVQIFKTLCPHFVSS